ncbi:DNA repair protein RecO [Massilibacterium senegalense]|uniref:DNA repair protein RecO n=1 Tax=Massilibacterium senegalense TaxID=1632858 RepID=UPI000780960F|nr:DNA repair protein RecO [Massilibacterium senegalense]
MLQKAEGIIIRTNDYGESHRIVTLYTRENGKVAVMARGARKPKSRLASGTQLFTYGYFLFTKSKGMKSLQQADAIDHFTSVMTDLTKTAYSAYIVELVDKLVDDETPNPYLFELLYQTLHYMDEGKDEEILTQLFEVKMLMVSGIRPVVDACVHCGNTEGEFHFSIREGGFICHRCFEFDPYRIQISQKTVRLLRLYYHFDLTRLGNISVSSETKKEIKYVLDEYFQAFSGVYLKSKRFLDQIQMME